MSITTETASVVTPYAQETSYETGRMIGRIDRQWGHYHPPHNNDAAMITGYELGWSEQDRAEQQDIASMPNTPEEEAFELEIDYAESMIDR